MHGCILITYLSTVNTHDIADIRAREEMSSLYSGTQSSQT